MGWKMVHSLVLYCNFNFLPEKLIYGLQLNVEDPYFILFSAPPLSNRVTGPAVSQNLLSLPPQYMAFNWFVSILDNPPFAG